MSLCVLAHMILCVYVSLQPQSETALLAEINDWKHSVKDLPNSVLSTSFAADISNGDQETHSHHTLPISTHEDSMDSDSLPELGEECADAAFFSGRLSSSSQASTVSVGSSESTSCRSSDSSGSDSHIDDVPLIHHHGNEEQRTYVSNGQLHWFKHDLSIGGFNHKFQTVRHLPIVKQCTATALINILLIIL